MSFATQLLEQYNIQYTYVTTPVIFRRTEENNKVAKQFVAAVVDISLRIDKLF